MATTGDLQQTKYAVALRLQSPAFLTLLAAIDGEENGILGTSFTTPGPAAVFDGEKTPQAITAQGYPVAEVIGVRTVYALPPQQMKEGQHQVEVHWTHTGDDELVITKQLERLVRATRDLFFNVSLTEIGSFPVVVASEEYSELMPAKAPWAFVKGSATVLQITTVAL